MQAEEKGPSDGRDDYTQDGTVDLKGGPVLRSRTGGWRACSFIVGYEIMERMAYYGIASNLVLYLTNKLHEGTVKSSNNVTNWVGAVWMTPLLGAYIADTHLGRYWTFIIASIIYLAGMCLLTLAVSLPSLRPPPCGGEKKDGSCDNHASPLQIGVFYGALYIIAIGTGGTKPNISTMGADQFDDFEPKERHHKLSFFNWWMFSIFVGVLFSNTFLVYIQDNVGWDVGYALPTGGLAISIIVFVIGTRYYRHKPRSESPMTKMAKVLVATARKWNVKVPEDPKELYELSRDEYSKPGKIRIDHSFSLSFLDRAAVKAGSESPWMLCPVTQVEETKQMMKMIPILVTTFIPSIMIAQISTLFVKQGTTLERHIGDHFKIPPASLGAFVTIFMLISIVIYDRLFVPQMRKYTRNPRGISLLQRMGIGFFLQIITMIVASFMERERLKVARNHGVFGKDQIVPLSIFILLPQFALIGVADSMEVAKLEFFYDQAPEGMKSLGTAYFTTSIGVGFFMSSFVLTKVAEVTKRDGHKGWILNNLNESRLDYYYALLALLGFINFLLFLVIAKFYSYNFDITERKIELQGAEMSPRKPDAESIMRLQ
ncbi:OLC1v1006959C1 [Oldenlandia corymbosa var. corymbosa]|uniref:OLC1v1006959C1 n=1 Tax=Oldenlandia corymbosa var. corymbosa TaxID=529605 RepID=A0AAV1DI87_OLDCO|nr:OLC1v1006959C1 [Oldenlandia corymbosa var. corymbosa]